MPLKSYAVLKARPKATRSSVQGHPHFQLQLDANGTFYRTAINVRSMLEPSEMEYLIKLRFGHPIISALRRLPPGLHPVERRPGGLALDYLRLNLFPRDQFLTLPGDHANGGADLNHVLEGIFAGAIADPSCWVYLYGEPWEADATDNIFHFYPSRGLHDIHMNQGNDPCHLEQDGVWQDGAVLIEHPRQQRWTGLFLKFQSQSWRTDPVDGHALSFPEGPFAVPCGGRGVLPPECTVRIAAAEGSRHASQRQPANRGFERLANHLRRKGEMAAARPARPRRGPGNAAWPRATSQPPRRHPDAHQQGGAQSPRRLLHP